MSSRSVSGFKRVLAAAGLVLLVNTAVVASPHGPASASTPANANFPQDFPHVAAMPVAGSSGASPQMIPMAPGAGSVGGSSQHQGMPGMPMPPPAVPPTVPAAGSPQQGMPIPPAVPAVVTGNAIPGAQATPVDPHAGMPVMGGMGGMQHGPAPTAAANPSTSTEPTVRIEAAGPGSPAGAHAAHGEPTGRVEAAAASSGGSAGGQDKMAHGQMAGDEHAGHNMPKELNQANVPLAFLLVFISVLAVAIGATIPFLDRFGIIDATSPRFLAGALSLASGVVIFLTLNDLLPSAQAELKESKVLPENLATPLSLIIFLGSLFGIFLAKRLGGAFKAHHHSTEFVVSEKARHSVLLDKKGGFDDTENLIGFSEKEKKELEKNTLSMVIALGVHNIPEGLSILAVTLADARLGILLTIGLVFHKIPEGIIVALPMYIATGNPWRGMMFAMIAGGASTFLGAILGYLFFLRFWNPAISGFLLSFVAGVLLYVALHGMLPTAHRHDPTDRVCSIMFVIGISILAGAGIIMELIGAEHH
ncbi:Zinc transporter [Quaeritorhiza haematococci]|nr:Zinc transporter [Quaeritorhiza haematococci]